MLLELAGKKALITGSSRGIGRAIAEALHGEGCRVALNSRTAEEVLSVASKLDDALAIVGDVRIPEQAHRIIHEATTAMGGLDLLICNVGSGRSVPAGEETPEEWQRVFDMNFWSTTNMVEAAREILSASKGAIICISSICGLEVVPDAPITYSVAKAALNAYVRGIARPLGKQGIRINAIAAGNILFEGSVWERKISADSYLVEKLIKDNVPMSRLGSPEDVANLAVYLASARADFATGSVWKLDGGQAHG